MTDSINSILSQIRSYQSQVGQASLGPAADVGRSNAIQGLAGPQATDATVDTWVRVLGTVSGEQQFRSKQGQVQTVPGVQARYVLKLAR